MNKLLEAHGERMSWPRPLNWSPPRRVFFKWVFFPKARLGSATVQVVSEATAVCASCH